MKKIFLTLGVCLLLAGCNGLSPAPPTATWTPPPSPTETGSPTPTASVTPTFTPSLTPTPEWTIQGPDRITVPIILYHHIAVSPVDSEYYVPPSDFEDQLRILRDWGYTSISTELLVRAITQGAPLPPRPIILTFDDGDISVYANGFPLMKKYGFTGVFYLVSNYLNAEGFVSTAQVKEMAAAGWEIGSHTIGHTALVDLASDLLRKEVVESKERLEAELGLPVRTIAYPFGAADPRVLDYAKFAGYIAGMGLGPIPVQDLNHLYYLQRRDIKGSYDIKTFIFFLPWQGDPAFIPTDTPTATPLPSRTPIPTYTQYPTRTP